MGTLQVRVARKLAEATGINSYELRAVDGKPLPAFTAGAHIDVVIREGLTRQYSLLNSPDDCSAYRIGVLLDPASRGGSVAMHDDVDEGDVLAISVPRNLFPLDTAKPALLFAGGIGVTPILCMAQALHANGTAFQMHYSAKSAAHAAFRDLIAQSGFAGQVHCHFDENGTRLDAQGVMRDASPDRHLYVCGPAGYIDHIVTTARELGWSQDRIHVEHFGATTTDATGNEAFEIRLDKRKMTLHVPADKTVLQVLTEHDVHVNMSCEQGVCGTCLTRVLDGVPDHRDMYLTDEEREENDQFLPCCSRSKSAVLVLDI